MHQAKWEKLLDQIERRFGLVEHGVREIPERHLTIETAVFDGASGRMKLERAVHPLVVDERVHYSKRIGGDVNIERVYSDSENVDTVTLYRWDPGGRRWDEMDLEDLTG
ncbi:MAG: hypothetical protein GF405_10480 [Candidatus Eisenbacteria bacterium]|nr:hypothetical protein [Candidatus Eisenbacteria bacterium]